MIPSDPGTVALWLESMKILDEVEPLKSGLYADGDISKLIKGKRKSR